MWIFGYGSLIWKVDFPYDVKILGYIEGFERKFYQYSTDHRGTPENPGRVVTLLPADDNSRVYGIAYKIPNSHIEQVLNHLDYREKGGYERQSVTFHPINEDEKPFEITIYLARLNNFNYAGPAKLDDIAEQILKSEGPSGPNIDYVFHLAESMRKLFPHVEDDHLFELEKILLKLMESKSICNS